MPPDRDADVATPVGAFHVRRFGSGPPLIALHGFTHHGGSFEELAACLTREVIAPDLPGHGRSRITPSIPNAVAAVIALLETLEPPLPLLGYSQGGRVALHVALARPDLVLRLVLVSTSPGIADPDARRIRRDRDDATADRIERAGVAAFLDDWLGGSIAGTTGLRDAAWRRADRARREENDAAGLAAALRAMSQGRQNYLGDRLGEIGAPVLVVAGGADEPYVRLARDMAERLRRGRLSILEHVPHNVVGADPAALAHVVQAFLDEP